MGEDLFSIFNVNSSMARSSRAPFGDSIIQRCLQRQQQTMLTLDIALVIFHRFCSLELIPDVGPNFVNVRTLQALL